MRRSGIPGRRRVALVVALALLPVTAGVAGAAPARRSTLHAGERLAAGQKLTSANGRWTAYVDPAGALVVRAAAGTIRWRSPAAGAGAYALIGSTGLLALRVGGAKKWTTRTSGSGRADVLTLRNDGVLDLTSGGLTAWSTQLPYACPRTSAKVFFVDVSRQWARMCDHRQQLRATFVTTGASAYGYGTPTGTWHVYAKSRNTTLYPAAGGAYPVKYWMPYSGPYGMHDSSWQRFPYGSSRYRTQGSHGCVHVPLPMMRWLYRWAPIGTRVTIQP